MLLKSTLYLLYSMACTVPTLRPVFVRDIPLVQALTITEAF